MNSKQSQSGFALLITVIVVTVTLAIGLTILEISTKTLALSTDSRQSESAFHAANAGLECIRYWRGDPSQRDEFLQQGGGSGTPEINCFGDTDSSGDLDNVDDEGGPDSDVYDYEFEVDDAATNRCVQATVVVLDSDDDEAEIDNSAYSTDFPWDRGSFTCPEHSVCTIAYIRGYNASCTSVNAGSGRFIQREVLIEF